MLFYVFVVSQVVRSSYSPLYILKEIQAIENNLSFFQVFTMGYWVFLVHACIVYARILALALIATSLLLLLMHQLMYQLLGSLSAI